MYKKLIVIFICTTTPLSSHADFFDSVKKATSDAVNTVGKAVSDVVGSSPPKRAEPPKDEPKRSCDPVPGTKLPPDCK